VATISEKFGNAVLRLQQAMLAHRDAEDALEAARMLLESTEEKESATRIEALKAQRDLNRMLMEASA
jgi:acyl-CoA synthetase (NDP forming)